MYAKFLLRRDAEDQVEKGHWGGHPSEEMSEGQSWKENPWPARDFRSLIGWGMLCMVEHVLEGWQFSYRFCTGLCSGGHEKLPCFWAEASCDQICFRESQDGEDQLSGETREKMMAMAQENLGNYEGWSWQIWYKSAKGKGKGDSEVEASLQMVVLLA